MALDAERLLARRLHARGAHFDPGLGVRLDPDRGFIRAGVPQQRAEQKVHRRHRFATISVCASP